MGLSQRQVSAASVGWLVRSFSQLSALHDDGFRLFSYNCEMTYRLCYLLAGVASSACSSWFGGDL